MSSYLTFYIVPKKDKGEVKEPLALMSYSRNSDIYQAFNENINVAYIGNDDKPNYTELTKEMVDDVVNATKKDYDEAQKSFNARMDAYRSVKLEGEAFDEYVEDFQSTTVYLKELEETIIRIELIASIVNDLDYSDFEKVLINID